MSSGYVATCPTCGNEWDFQTKSEMERWTKGWDEPERLRVTLARLAKSLAQTRRRRGILRERFEMLMAEPVQDLGAYHVANRRLHQFAQDALGEIERLETEVGHIAGAVS